MSQWPIHVSRDEAVIVEYFLKLSRGLPPRLQSQIGRAAQVQSQGIGVAGEIIGNGAVQFLNRAAGIARFNTIVARTQETVLLVIIVSKDESLIASLISVSARAESPAWARARAA